MASSAVVVWVSSGLEEGFGFGLTDSMSIVHLLFGTRLEYFALVGPTLLVFWLFQIDFKQGADG